MRRRKNNKLSFIDGKKYFLAACGFKENQEVVYKRMSDDAMSLGKIKWFEEHNDAILVTLTDCLIGSFQSCYISDIESSPDKKKLKKLREKML